jgi:PPM family protein phosphatase
MVSEKDEMQKEYVTMEGGQEISSGMLPVAVTDIGCEREINEDRYAGFKVEGGYVWIVCDGMGGAVGGELAAQLALDTIKRSIESFEGEVSIDMVSQAIQEANRVIVLRRQNPVFSGMGTTIVAALVNDEGVFIAHVGDSRAYVVSRNRIEQLMVDHTYVQDLVDKGMITYEESLDHPQSHVLTRCLGADPRAKVDQNIYGIVPSANEAEQEFLLLCSDGLYSLVSEAEIHQVVMANPLQQACMKMVESARDRGGFDNITLAIIPLNGVLSRDISFTKKETPKPERRVAAIESSSYSGSRRQLSKVQLFILILILSFISMVVTVIGFFSFFG